MYLDVVAVWGVKPGAHSGPPERKLVQLRQTLLDPPDRLQYGKPAAPIVPCRTVPSQPRVTANRIKRRKKTEQKENRNGKITGK